MQNQIESLHRDPIFFIFKWILILGVPIMLSAYFSSYYMNLIEIFLQYSL